MTGIDGDPLDRLGGVIAGGAQRAHPLAQRQRLADRDVGPAQPPALRPREPDEPAEVLRPLAAPAGLGGHPRDLVQLVVDDRYWHEVDLGSAARFSRIGQIAQYAVHRRTQLAGASAPALDRPGEVGPLPDEMGDVGPQGQPVDGDVLGRPLDEDDPGAADQVAHDGEVEVGSAEGVERRKPA